LEIKKKKKKKKQNGQEMFFFSLLQKTKMANKLKSKMDLIWIISKKQKNIILG